MKAVVDTALFIALLYAGVVALMYFKQRSMIYFADTYRPAPIEGVETITVQTADGLSLQGAYVPPSPEIGVTIIYFHGNAGHHLHRLFKAQHYIDAGYGVLLAEYRGYGGNDGSPSEQGFYRDSRAFMDFLIEEKGVKPDQLVVYGESIGSGSATQMAVEYDVAALILEAPFDSLVNVAAKKYFFIPVKYLLKDKFANVEKVAQIKAPLLIMHGEADRTIPFSHAQNLYSAAREPKVFKAYPEAGHNFLYDHGASRDVLQFLAGIIRDNADNKGREDMLEREQ